MSISSPAKEPIPQRLMVSLSRELRERISKLASDTDLSESRIAAELIARGLGQRSVLALPESEAR